MTIYEVFANEELIAVTKETRAKSAGESEVS